MKRVKALALWVIRALLLASIACIYFVATPSPASAATVYKSGTIATSETWTSDNVYVINGSLTIGSGITVTVQAGTVVKFSLNQYMTVDGILSLHIMDP